MMDAAHLSQTLYLVATELGLGAFITAAINNVDIEERLGIDGYREGVLAVCGFGRPAAERSAFDPEFLPFVPRETRPDRPGRDAGI
jgi:nitroreductase